MSKPFVYYCKQDPWQDDLDGNHGLPVLLARRSDEPGSEAIWCAQSQVWKPFPDLLGRLLGGDWWDSSQHHQALWHRQGCAPHLERQGLVPAKQRTLVGLWADLLAALQQGSPDIAVSAEEMAGDIP